MSGNCLMAHLAVPVNAVKCGNAQQTKPVITLANCLPTSKIGYWTTRGYANSLIANSRTGRVTDWTSPGLVNSRTGQVADWTTRGCLRRLCMFSFPYFGGICETASCPVCELTSPRDVQSVSWQSTSWRIRELSSYRKISSVLPIILCVVPRGNQEMLR